MLEMKYLAPLLLLLLCSCGPHKKKVSVPPPPQAVFPIKCDPKAELVKMNCTPIAPDKWKCVGGYAIVTSHCIEFVSKP